MLSRFAGAAAECSAALVVNPYDPETVAASIATRSPCRSRRRERHAALFRVISDNDIYWWGEHFLAALTADTGPALVRAPLNVAPPLYSGIA